MEAWAGSDLFGLIGFAVLGMAGWIGRSMSRRLDQHDRTLERALHKVELLEQRMKAAEQKLVNYDIAMMKGAEETGRNAAEHASLQASVTKLESAISRLHMRNHDEESGT